ncbi:general stress protein [Nitratifractor sp.]
MEKKEILIGIYESREAVKEAVQTLLREGIEAKNISVVGRGHEDAVEKVEIEKENSDVLIWGSQGAFWGGLLGALLGGVFFIVPGFGPLVGAGPITAALAGMVGGAMTGGAIFGLGDALIEWGIAELEAHRLEKLVKEGKILLLVHGSRELVERAKEILDRLGKGEIKIHG